MRHTKLSGKKYFGVLLLALALLVMGTVVPAQADVTWNWAWDGMMTKTGNYPTPTNGWVDLTVTNNTNFAWGDMHFEIWSCSWMGCGDITNVDFVDNHPSGSPLSPDSDRSPFSYSIDNVSVGAKLDYFYYSDPIFTGNTGQFKFMVNNPDGNLYTLAVTPTIVPEPISSTLFIIGGATLGFRRFRKAKRDI